VILNVPTYRPTGSALHAARAGVGIAYCAALCLPALVFDSPLVLGATLAGVVGAGARARVGSELWRAARLALPLAILVALVNPLVSREGLTVLVDGPTVPVLGNVDVTLEALAWGGISGLRVLVVVLAFAVYSACVDPDQVLRLTGRVAPRSALTASLATRAVPMLARDGVRLAEAYGLRAGATPTRRARDRIARAATLTRALGAGALERSVELAAALEVKGYGAMRRFAPRPAPWSRHDIAFAVSSAALVAIAVAGRIAGLAAFDAYPLLQIGVAPADLALAGAITSTALAPFALAGTKRAAARRHALSQRPAHA
jgi:energy-coupling factor transport system permease protein